MTSEVTDYREGAFADEPLDKDIPVKVHIIAPSTLPEGYTFEAEVGAGEAKKTISVEVPPGGVVEGQVFLVPLPDDFAVGEPRVNAPTGHWKDGPFDMLNAGICHASLWCGLCCTQVAMAQVMQRLRLNWLGEAAPEAATKNTFKVVLTLVLCYTVFTIALEMVEAQTGYYQIPTWIPVLRFIGGVLFTIYSIYSLMKLRENVRAKYSIPEEKCPGMEDLCCSMWCSCCVVSQMARHTGEYETYKGRFCSETGMAAHTPSIV
jgi:Cys-rich protein (TIGR01571 family)